MSFYRECIKAFNDHDVKFLVFGGFAVNFYGYNRYTADLDLWVDPVEQNLQNLNKAIQELGFEPSETLNNFFQGKTILLRLKDNHHKIDILQKINLKKSFSECAEDAVYSETAFGYVHFIGYQDLIDEKILSRRPKDLIDVQELNRIRNK